METYRLTYYPEVADPYEELLKLLDNTTEEEKMLIKVKEFCSKPRIMAKMDDIVIK